MADSDLDKIPNEGNKVRDESYTIICYSGCALPGAYLGLVLSKWLRSLRYGNDYFKLIDSDAYYAAYQTYIENMLKRSALMVRLSVLTSDHDVVFGFSVFEGECLHYVHVHKDCRNIGIGMSLVPSGIKTITHVTKNGMRFWNSKLPDCQFNPFK